MARGPQGQWRPDDPIAAAVQTMKIATGELKETLVEEDAKDSEESEDARQTNN